MKKTPVRALTESQVKALVSAPDGRTRYGNRDRALIAVMAYGGLRIAEACSLSREDIELDGRHTRLTFVGKGGKQRTVSLPQRAATVLKTHLTTHTSPFVFPTALGGGSTGHLMPRHARLIVQSYAREVGLPTWFHPHSLRHTYASTVQRKLGDLHLTQNVLGHSSPATTAAYYLAFDPRYADKAAAVFE